MEVQQQTRCGDQLAKAIAAAVASIDRLTSHAKLSESRYPYFPLTFSLWRCDKYEELLAQTPSELHQQAALQFHQSVDQQLLDVFAKKVEQSIVACFNELKTPQSLKLKQLIGQNDALVESYSRAAARQLTLLERFLDLVELPYGVPIKETLSILNRFSLETQRSSSSLTELVTNHGQDVAFKGLGKIGTQLCNKFIVGLTTIVGGVNLAGIAGGLAFSKLFEVVNGRLNDKKVAERLRQQLTVLLSNSEFLQQRYQLCRKLLLQYLQAPSTDDRRIIRDSYMHVLREVFTMDCEQFVVVKEADDGWKVVELQNNEQFEEL